MAPSLGQEGVLSTGHSATLQDAVMAAHVAPLCVEEEHAGSRSEGSIGQDSLGGALQLWRGFQRLGAAEAREGFAEGARRSQDLAARDDSRGVADGSGLEGGGTLDYLESRSGRDQRERRRTPTGGIVGGGGQRRGGHVPAGWRVCLRASYCLVTIFVLALLQLSEAAAPPAFTVRTVSQSTPLPDALNTLTFSLVSSAALRGENASAITIAGLHGAIVDSAWLPLLAASGGNGATGLFCHNGAPGAAGSDADSQGVPRLTLTLCGDATLQANVAYAFAAVVRNPAAAQASPMVNVSASGTFAAAATMLPSDGTVLGVLHGAAPLLVITPSFVEREVGQRTPLSGQHNTLTITLSPNVDLSASDRSSITISGLVPETYPPASPMMFRALTPGVNSLGLVAPAPPPAVMVHTKP